MTFQLKQVSEHGTANPIVARLSLQTVELLQFSSLDKNRQDEVFALFHGEVQPRLLECDDIAQEISKEIMAIANELNESGLITQSQGRVIEVPNLMRLEQRVEQFLYCAKSALRDLSKLFGFFFAKEFNEARFDKIHSWAVDTFGEDSELAVLIKQDHDLWIKQVVAMRNAVEHPGGFSGNLHIHNFELATAPHSMQHKLSEPCWHRNDDPKSSIANDLLVFVTNILEFCEDLLVVCIKMTGFPDFLQFVQIPESERDVKCAKRLRVAPVDNKI